MLLPKFSKFKKHHKGRVLTTGGSVSLSVNNVCDMAVVATESGRISAHQLESMRKAARKLLKRSGKVVINPFPHTPITSKPLEVRMGKGKGAVAYWATKIRPGSFLVGVTSTNKAVTMKTIEVLQKKIAVRVKAVPCKAEKTP